MKNSGVRMTKGMVSANLYGDVGAWPPSASRGKAPGQGGADLKLTTFIIFMAHYEDKLMIFCFEKVVKIKHSNTFSQPIP